MVGCTVEAIPAEGHVEELLFVLDIAVPTDDEDILTHDKVGDAFVGQRVEVNKLRLGGGATLVQFQGLLTDVGIPQELPSSSSFAKVNFTTFTFLGELTVGLFNKLIEVIPVLTFGGEVDGFMELGDAFFGRKDACVVVGGHNDEVM